MATLPPWLSLCAPRGKDGKRYTVAISSSPHSRDRSNLSPLFTPLDGSRAPSQGCVESWLPGLLIFSLRDFADRVDDLPDDVSAHVFWADVFEGRA